MVFPPGTLSRIPIRRTTAWTVLGALALLLMVPTNAFAVPVPGATSPSLSVASHAIAPFSSAAAMSGAIRTLAAGEGPAFGHSLPCTAASATTATCANAPGPRGASVHASPHPGVLSYGWQNMSPGQGTFPVGESYGASMAWDAADNEIVYFGGCDQRMCPDDQTWVFYNFAWFNATNLVSAPPAVYYASMTYDYNAKAVLLFGGCGLVQCPMNETWIFKAGTWTNVSAPFCFITCLWAPPPRQGAVMAFANDSKDNVTVLFGGCLDVYCYTSDGTTWEWVGAAYAWIPVTPSSAPSGREYASMSYNPIWGSLLLFGGCTFYCYHNDTWEFYNGTWVNLTTENTFFGFSTPEGRGGAMMSYDLALGETLLTGGAGYVSGPNTWAWSCPYFCGWVNITTLTDLPGRVDVAAMASESSYYAPISQGGVCNCGTGYLSSTWVYEPVMSINPTVAPNPTPARVATTFTAGLFGGTQPWFWFWTPGDLTYFLYDGTHTYAVPGIYTANLYAYDRYGVFQTQNVSVTVTSTAAHASVTMATTDVGIADTFSTPVATGGTGPYSYNWSFGDGSWGTNASSVTHAYGAIGTFTANLTVHDVNGLYNNSSVSVTVVAKPTVSIAASAMTVDVGTAITFTPTAAGGTGAYTYAWTLGDSGTSTSTAPSHAYAAAGTYHVNVTVTDAVGGSGTATLTVTVNPAVSGTVSATPLAVHTNVTVNFSATGTGGSGTFTYVWTFGDGAKATTGSASHQYTRAGNYTATAWINDSLGGSYHHAVTISVTAPPSGNGGGSSTGSSLPGWTTWAIVGVVIIVVALLAIVMLMRRRKPSPPTGGAPPSGAAGGGPATPPPGAQ